MCSRFYNSCAVIVKSFVRWAYDLQSKDAGIRKWTAYLRC